MDEQNQDVEKPLRKVYVLFRLVQGSGWTASQNLVVFDDPRPANQRAKEMGATLQKLMPGEIVKRKGDLAEVSGIGVQQFMGMIGVANVGYGVWECEVQGDILIPKPRIVLPS